jgi:hypothetical protein
MPWLVAGLPDVGRTGSEGKQAFQLGVLVPVDWVDVDVQGEPSGPGVFWFSSVLFATRKTTGIG